MRLIHLSLIAWLVPGLAWAAPDTPPAKKPAPISDASGTIASKDVDAPPAEYNTAVLQGLNKVTGKISKLDGLTGTVMRFGNLEIIAHRCWKSNPEDTPENAALLEISELKPGEAPTRIFLGWMFSSSPGLSGLEHPVYDITLLSCELRKDPEPPEAKPDKSEKPKTDTKSVKKP